MILPRLIALALAMLTVLALPVRAGTTLLRDADIEYALSQLAAPVLQAAGLPASGTRIVLIDDSSLNAFVADTSHIFIHSGLMMKLETAAQLQAVIAHEAAHIANGHLSRRIANMRSARTAAGLGMVLAAAAAASGSGQGSLAIAAGSAGSAMRLFLSHTRAEESSADLSSVRYLVRAGIDPRAAIQVQRLFSGQESLSVQRQDPYTRTHPLSRDRLRALESLAAGQAATPPNATAEYWFARARGKLTAFKRAPSWTLRRAEDSASRDIALMRQAVAHHRNSATGKAIAAIDGALALRKGDPYLMELKGQILLESRNFGAAVQVYQAAARTAPREPLILGGLGRAMLAAGDFKAALQPLEAARGRDASDARVLRDLAVAYAKLGQPGMASVATAERYALQGRMEDAELHAKRAIDQLPRGSGPWQRAEDVLSAAKRAK
ncbi:M48 family metalloprotease [Thetidibacter halocola]|uniref:M48 family metalloprotease n=1 Tax=Thetidibacter halocola TaxID=2827239 RepID=A0A8J7WCP7_9RHOB|nr:M48 family metalloprotease [Thetidibacter halocola]MBS0122728.1 M48 family metalloprotease [Thetidibacter halocola]